MNNQDPFASSRPQHKNEKMDIPKDDPFFSTRPENLQKQYKQPVERYTNPSLEGTEDILPWYERGDRFSTETPVVSGTPEETLEAGKGIVSGATLGASELIPGFK